MIEVNQNNRFRIKMWWGFGLLILSLCLPAFLLADQARYIYDELGRLVRAIDGQGNVATYTYDAVGNLFSITRANVADLQPQIRQVVPDFARAPSSIQITLTGVALLGSRLSTDNLGVTATVLRTTESSIVAHLDVVASARLGPTILIVDNGIAHTTALITIYSAAPAPFVTPEQITVKPHGGTAQITVGITQVDTFPVILSLSVQDPSIAIVSSDQVILPAGIQSTTVTVTSGDEGRTNLVVSSGSGHASAGILSFALTGLITAQSPLVSIALASVPVQPGPFVAPSVSVALEALPVQPGPILAPLVSIGLETVPVQPGPILAPLISIQVAPP